MPSSAPSSVPSLKPSLSPSNAPSSTPSTDPSSAPSFVPSSAPSCALVTPPTVGFEFEDSLDSWSISGAEGSVDRICDAGAPEGNCYVGLSGTQSITRDFRLCGPGCVSFYFAWNEEDSLPYNDFMRVSYVDEIGDSTTLLTLNVASGDQRSWQKVAFDIPDEAVGSVLKFEGLVQNVQDNTFNSYLFLDNIEVSQGSCPSSEPITL